MEVLNRALDASFDVDLVFDLAFDWLHREQTNALCWAVPSAMLLIGVLSCVLLEQWHLFKRY